ncbi:MAG: C25 family cysteine peptidase, partial [Methanothrix sp.]|nr:C25 family cysteine peptidase [Methanothrix sp.]
PVPLSYTGPVEPVTLAADVYGSSKPFPRQLNTSLLSQDKRGFGLKLLNLFPVEYIPSKGTLSYYRQITVKVWFKPGPMRLRFRGAKQTDQDDLRGLVENQKTLATYPASIPRKLSSAVTGAANLLDPGQNYQYVIITNEALRNSAFQDLIAHKQSRGITATIVTTEWIYANYDGTRPDGVVDNQTKIRDFIIDAYHNWETEYVLLGGYTGIIPARLFWVQDAPNHPYYVTQMPSDMYYGCLDGTFDNDADGFYGEPTDGPGGGEVDLFHEVYVGRAPVENATEAANFVTKTLAYANSSDEYLHVATMMGEYLGFGGVADYAKPSMEEIRLGSDSHGYTTMGFENSPSSQFFVTDYTEIPDCTGRPPTLYDGTDESWSKADLINFLNNGNCGYSGTHILNHLGHANFTYSMKMYTSDIPSLTNEKYFFAYSQGCMAGGFDTRNSFAEQITAGRYGAFAVIMNARYGWGLRNSTNGASQRFNRPFWHGVLNQKLVQLGKANAYSKEFNSTHISDNCMRWCYYELNLFGDPETSLKTGADGIQYETHTIDDDSNGSSRGDGDMRVEPGETIEMPVTLRNLSSNPVHNARTVLSSSDSYVTIIRSNQSFGDIPATGTATSVTGSLFTVDSSCPDAHVILFQLAIYSDEGTWTSTFTVQVHRDPDITVAPMPLAVTVPRGGTASRLLAIGNMGVTNLNFNTAFHAVYTNSNPQATGSGGPDTYGYTWKDSDAAGGPSYNWVEINSIGTPVSLAYQYAEIFLPFPFSFYGLEKTKMRITSYGYLTFGKDSADMWADPIPNTAAPNDLVAPFWYYLDPAKGGCVYYYHDASQSRFIVEYDAVAHYDSSGSPETFQVILYPSGAILFQYKSLSSPQYATVGIENSFGTDGLQVVRKRAYLHNGLAVLIQPPPDWLSVNPTSGTVAPGQVRNLTASFDATGLAGGSYEGNLVVLSDDPDSPQVIVPVTMTVGGEGSHTITASASDHGRIKPSGQVRMNGGENAIFTITP